MAPSLSDIYAVVRLYRRYRAQQHGTIPQTQGDSSTDRSDARCVYCNSKERLLTFRKLKRGDHICMGGAKLQFNLGAKQVYFYTHHAIVKEVKFIDDSRAMLTLIHFTDIPYDKTIKIQETSEMRNLFNDEIYVIKYRHQTRDVDNIIDRAESLIDQDISYRFFNRNCETLAHWCVIGQEKSLQVTSFLQFLNNILRISGNAVTSFIFKIIKNALIVGIDDATQMIVGGISGATMYVFMTIVYALYCKKSIKTLSDRRAHGEICSSCFEDQRRGIWLKFGAFCTPQLVGIIAIPVLGYGAVATLAVCSVLSLGLLWNLRKLRLKLRTPFRGIQYDINCLQHISIGDVVSFKYRGMAHDGIVSSVKVLPRTRGKQCQFKIIHYALPVIIRSREIREDTMDIDLNNTYFKLHDYTGYGIHPPEDVVKRARKRIGETKFSIFSNRSCHFCHWAKVKESPMSMPYQEKTVDFVRSLQSTDVVINPVYVDHRRGAKHATKTLPTKRVILRDDVTKGQLIKFKYKKLWHKAICTDVKPGQDPSKLVIYIVHYGRNYTVIEESISFNLKQTDIYICNFHPLYKYREDEIIKRARDKIGEDKYNLCTRRSSHLAEEAICKDKDTHVVRLDEIQKGDVIIFQHWSLKHEAIVSDVIICDAKTNDIGSIKLIHYALSSLFSTREIREEYIHVHLQRDRVYIKSFPGYTMYPNDMVVKRARGRVGERRFHSLYNTSFDFVHWAKVIQQPSVISMTPVDEAGVATGAARHEVFLIPRVGPTYEEFQVDWIKTWDELKPGNIVQYRYYLLPHRGIVSAVHPSLNMVTVIHYGTATIFSKRTIMKEKIPVDLTKDLLHVYRCDPAKCHPLETVVKKAKARVGEQDWKNGNRTWDFCKACTLKNYQQQNATSKDREDLEKKKLELEIDCLELKKELLKTKLSSAKYDLEV